LDRLPERGVASSVVMVGGETGRVARSGADRGLPSRACASREERRIDY
jgi:hypothetical protein